MPASKSPEKEDAALIVEPTDNVKVETEDKKTEDGLKADNDKAESEKESVAKNTEDSDKKATKAGPKKKLTGAAASKKKKGAAAVAAPRIVSANPGEHYLVKLKGFPAWPAIIADEDMLPTQLLSTRPVTAKRADGTYREDYAEGGKRMNDRTFPVMYLATNEFGWVPNTILSELPTEKAKEANTTKMRKDLQAAFKLAIEAHPIEYYKDLLQSFQEEMIAAEEAAKEEAERKAKISLEVPDDDAPKKTKKRKAGDDSRSDSKKPKIKLSVGRTNGEKTKPKTNKPKQAAKKATSTKETTLPTMTLEERHERKEKEVRFLRHKLQKGLLTRDVKPKAEEMPSMNDYLTKLEGFPDLEVAIIRATKINKVLKAILKLDSIPRDEEFEFKARSTELLGKWNKLLAAEPATNGHDSKPNGKEEEIGDLTVIGDRTMKVAEAEVEGDKADDEV